MPNGAWILRDWTLDPIEMDCVRCGRSGRYRRARLLDRFGPDQSMPHMLTLISNCPNQGSHTHPCAIKYRDTMDAWQRRQREEMMANRIAARPSQPGRRG